MNPCNKKPTYGTANIPRKAAEVEQLLEKIEELGLVTYTKDGTMSASDKKKLDSLLQEIPKKANKVDTAVPNNLVSFTDDGDIKDSGKSIKDFATAQQGKLAETAYQKPAGGIPACDIAPGVIPRSTRDAVLYTKQILTEEQKRQARINIGATLSDIGYNTTEYWDNLTGYIPAEGEIVIYSDHSSKEVDGETVYIPAIKIGTGNAYVQDLAFIDEDISNMLMDHINDMIRHITEEERLYWNNKLNVNDLQEVSEEVLIFNRN